MNRARIAERAANNPTIHTGPNFTFAPVTYPARRYQGRPAKRPSGNKGQGMWRTVSTHYRCMISVDKRWDK